MRHIVALCLLLVAVVALAVAPQPAPERITVPKAAPVEIEGLYAVQDAPTAFVTIRRREAGYFVQWNREDHLPDMGIGMRRDAELLVGFTTVGETAPGVARYVIEADGPKLNGVYMTASGKMRTEVLTFVRPMGKLKE